MVSADQTLFCLSSFLFYLIPSQFSLSVEKSVCSWWPQLPALCLFRLIICAAAVLGVSVWHAKGVPDLSLCRGLTDESEILKFLQHGTLVGLLPVPHPILIRKYQANSGTAMWFRTYMWGVIYLR